MFAFSLLLSAASANDGIEFFEKKVRPILIERCYECHSSEAKKLKGGLRLDTRQGWATGGDSGPAIIPNDPDSSLLIKAVRHEAPDLEMPPKEKLLEAEIETLVQWIKMGAPDPREETTPAIAKEGIDLEKGRQFWAFKPLAVSGVPEVKKRSWPRNEIDLFILAKLEAQKLKPVSDADPRDLVRRIFYDLIGLPPTSDQIEKFLHASPKTRVAKLVDELLASPCFGEKWGRHWLDLARYAESTGGGRSSVLANAWRYRNYVIESFNRDKPYDQFLREQIAGDLLPYTNDAQRAEQLIATGFLALGPKNLDLQDKEQLRMNTVDEQIDTVGRSVLAMTLGCARCHDHKFDPIPTADYYALAGIFRSTKSLIGDNVSRLVELPLEKNPSLVEAGKQHSEAVAALKSKLSRTKNSVPVEELGKGELENLENELKKLESKAPVLPHAICVTDEKETADYNICVRGNVHLLGPKVPRGFLQVASREAMPPKIEEQESGRRELADWLVNTNNPLTARVYVNRIWHQLFGAGLVRSVDNFGQQGDQPTHLELLDYLAVRFMRENWSTKKLICEMILSHAYQLSAQEDSACREVDPVNNLRWRMMRRRLDAEAIRDTILMVSGGLELRQVDSLLPVALQTDTALRKTTTDVASLLNPPLRSVYIPVFREEGMNDLFEVFDFANPSFSSGQRHSSTLPTQALYLMNSPFVMEQSRRAAEALLKNEKRSFKKHLQDAYLKTLGRPPTSAETRLAENYLKASMANENSEVESWSHIFHTLFACVDFRYLN